MGWINGVQFLAEVEKGFFSPLVVTPRLALGHTHFPIQCIPGGSYPSRKMPEMWSWPFTPSSVVVKNTWSCTSILPYIFMAWYLFKHRDNFTFTLSLAVSTRIL